MKNLLQKASDYLRVKNYKEAADCAQKALKQQPQLPSALFIQAIAYSELGLLSKALANFKTLIKLHPNNPEVYYNQALILEKFNKNNQAIDSYKLAIKYNSRNPIYYVNLANQMHKTSDFAGAIKTYQQALQIDPQNSGIITNLSHSFYANKEYLQCIELLNNLGNRINLDKNHINTLVHCFVNVGNYRQAYELSKNHTKINPDEFIFHYLLGYSALKMCRYPVAIDSFETSLKLNNSHVLSYKNLAITYNYIAKYEQSNQTIKNLLTLTNNNLDTVIFVCTLKEMQNDLFINDEYFSQALTLYPKNEELLLIKAKLLISEAHYDKAFDILTKLENTSVISEIIIDVQYTMAKVFDKQKSYDQAWTYLQKANATNSNDLINDTFNTKITNSIQQLNNIDAILPTKTNNESDFKVLFIVGFPRSGTTLIDSILSCHPQSLVLEEVPLLDDIANSILKKTTFDNYFHTLRNLTQDQITELRNKYINNIHLYHQWNNNEVIIDKSPMNIFHAFLIGVLFPKAPIIFALRHPLDVCISCFMQNFRSNAELVKNFTSQKSIAQTYDNLLTLWKTTVSKIPLNYHYLRYEDLTTNFEIQVKTLIDFVDFQWNDDYLSFYKQTKNRGMIHTPSYNQVNQPIHQKSQFRFQHYKNHINEFIAPTKKWISFFNYNSDI